MPTNDDSFVRVQGHISEGYRAVLKRILEAGHCPFCPEHFAEYHNDPILLKVRDWFITQNSWSYKEADHRFLIIPEIHKEKFEDLSIGDFATIGTLTRWAIEKFNIAGGALLLRFGDPKFTGATVRHLHFQLLSARITDEGKTAPVWFPIG